MTTKDEIINLADSLIRDKGYNAFSFNDISKAIGIKTSSIHYYFPTKSDLGISVIKEQSKRFNILIKELADKSPEVKLEEFFNMYAQIKSDNKICLVGSLATDFNTIDKTVKNELKKFAEQILNWVTEILTEGKEKNIFSFQVNVRTKAIMIISNMLAIVQLSRLTNNDDFEAVKKAIIIELKQN
ncbi:MAG: TetR/AcrR family transcriptional regulator [Bacteroidales bacterium]|nr:TetR/AcrR family transcriptional regulator [Bacteroidales bacterium]